MRRQLVRLAILASGALGSTLGAEDPVGLGPLRLESQSPFQSLRANFLPRAPTTMAAGSWEFLAMGTWVNVWAVDDAGADRYRLDFEILHSDLEVAYAPAAAWRLALRWSRRDRFGGAMDGFIQGFHDLFGIDQSGRDEVPRDEVVARLVDDDEVVIDNRASGRYVIGYELQLEHRLVPGGGAVPAVSAAIGLRWNDSEVQDDALDLIGTLSLARRFGEHAHAYLVLGATRFGTTSFATIELERYQVGGMVAGEWRFAEGQALIGQYLVTSGAVSDIGPFDRPSHEVTLGWKGRIRPDLVLEFGLIENLFTFDNSPDFGVHGGATWRP